MSVSWLEMNSKAYLKQHKAWLIMYATFLCLVKKSRSMWQLLSELCSIIFANSCATQVSRSVSQNNLTVILEKRDQLHIL